MDIYKYKLRKIMPTRKERHIAMHTEVRYDIAPDESSSLSWV